MKSLHRTPLYVPQIPAPTTDLTISEQQVEAQLLQSPLQEIREYIVCFGADIQSLHVPFY